MKWSNRLYFGTWQLSGQFKNLSPAYIESLLLFAIESGICRFDTAAVYGEGKVEEILGACLPKYVVIVTKIPAIKKPSLEVAAPINEFYTLDYINRSVEGSLRRLRRTQLDTVLLHNWLPSWSSKSSNILHHLQDMKNKGIVRRVGISLSNNFSAHVNDEILPFIDVIEAPYNPNQEWVLEQLPKFIDSGKEVLLRSLFDQGKLLAIYSAESLVADVAKLGTSMVIGMTTENQVAQNIHHLKKGGQQ